MFELILRYNYSAIICKEADTRWNVFVDVVDVQQKSICPRTETFGTPDETYVMSDRAPLTETRCLRFDRKDVIQLCVLQVIPCEVSLDRSRLCGTLSKDLVKSKRIASICVLLSNAVIQSCDDLI